MAWQMPVYREPTTLELAIEDSYQCLQEYLSQLIGANEMLAHWWNHPHRQPLCLFTIVIAVSTIWLAYSCIASWRVLQAAAAQMALQPAPQDDSDFNSSPHQSSLRQSTTNARSPPKTPVQRKSIQSLNGAKASGSQHLIGNHISFGIGSHIGGGAGRVSTPEYQTPFASTPTRCNFSGLAKAAPVSYNTLQCNGMLDAEGTPTKKYSSASPAQDEGEYVLVYYSPTKSWGNVRRSLNGPNEVQRQTEGVEVCWMEDGDGGHVQQFPAAKRK